MAAVTRRRTKSLAFVSSSRFPISSSSLPSADFDEEVDETLVSTAISILKEHRSRSRWSHLKSLLPPSSIPAPATVRILSGLRNRPHLALSFFIFSRRRDLLSLSAAAHVAARSRLRPAALDLLRSAVRIHDSADEPTVIFEALARSYRAFDSAPFVFDLLVRAYLDAKKPDRAVHIVRLLRSRGIQPLLPTCNSLIRSVSKRNGYDAGLEIYRELFGSDKLRARPSVQIFNTLLLAFYQDGKSDRAGEIRMEMEKHRVEPNVFTYSVLMAGLCEDGGIREARDLWDEMAGRGIKPDIMAFNTLISGFSEAGEMEVAEQLFRDMVFGEIEPTCATYEHLIKGHCKVGDLESAMMLYEEMKRKGFGPEAEIVDEVVEEMCKRGRAGEAQVVFRDEMRREGFRPSRKSYEALIGGFCATGEIEVATRLQAEMAGRGFAANERVYVAFVEGYRRQGDMKKAAMLREEMQQMGLISNTPISAFLSDEIHT